MRRDIATKRWFSNKRTRINTLLRKISNRERKLKGHYQKIIVDKKIANWYIIAEKHAKDMELRRNNELSTICWRG